MVNKFRYDVARLNPLIVSTSFEDLAISYI